MIEELVRQIDGVIVLVVQVVPQLGLDGGFHRCHWPIWIVIRPVGVRHEHSAGALPQAVLAAAKAAPMGHPAFMLRVGAGAALEPVAAESESELPHART